MNERSTQSRKSSSVDISRRNLLGLAGGAAATLALGHKASHRRQLSQLQQPSR
jgi:hypothetical protein